LAFEPTLLDATMKGSLHPDHVVHMGELPLAVEPGDDEAMVRSGVGRFREKNGYLPRFAVVRGLGVLLSGETQGKQGLREEFASAHARVLRLIGDASRIRFLPNEECRYLVSWEWGRFRVESA